MEVVGVGGSCLVEGGGGEGVVGDAVDLAGQAPCALEQGLDGGSLEQGQFASREAEAVLEIGVDLLSIEAGEMVSDDDALAEGLVHGHRQPPPELGEADEDEAHALLRIHGEVGEQAEVFEDVVAQVVGLVDDEDGQLLGLLGEAGDLGPDRVVCRGAGSLDGEPDLPCDRFVHVEHVACGEVLSLSRVSMAASAASTPSGDSSRSTASPTAVSTRKPPKAMHGLVPWLTCAPWQP